MTNLAHSALLFEASTKFQNASGALETIAKGEPLESSMSEALVWAAHFLDGLDNSRSTTESASTNNLAVQATQARPSIYASFLGFRRDFLDLGVNSQDSISAFFSALYILMQSGGTSIEAPFDSSPQLLQLASRLFRGASRDLLNQIDDGRLPERPVLHGM